MVIQVRRNSPWSNGDFHLKRLDIKLINSCLEFQVELNCLQRAYEELTKQMNKIYAQRLWFVMLEQFLMKYVWSGTGMIMVSLPIIAGVSLSKSR